MSQYRKKPIITDNKTFGISPRPMPIQQSYIFPTQEQYIPTQEEIERQRQEDLHNAKIQSQRFNDLYKQQRLEDLHRQKLEHNNNKHFASLQERIAQRTYDTGNNQPKWGGNSLGNVVQQPNYSRVDYLEPIPFRKV